MRADIFLYQNGLAKSRSHAQALIKEGVTLLGRKIDKPSLDIPEGTDPHDIHIENPSRYVSRGGVKLEGALRAFSLDVTGLVALDLGASTGGFTDCLLQSGAKKVFAIDVGHGQLDEKLLHDPRVVNMEGINARSLENETLGELCDLAVSDLSFISQSLVYETVRKNIKTGGLFVSLIKPQFEAGKEHLSKNGIVRERKVHATVIERLFVQAEAAELFPEALAVSPIEGGDGNREYLALFRIGERRTPAPQNIKSIVFGVSPNEKAKPS